MAIALPLPIEPQLAPMVEVRKGINTHFAIGQLHFELNDDCGLGTRRIREVVLKSKTPSDIVRGLGDACSAAGWPAERTIYAVEGSTIYVAIHRGRIASVSAPGSYETYFSSLAKRPVLSQSQLEGARALADSLSERAGENYSLALEASGNDAAKLSLKGPTDGRSQFQGSAGFSTSGNRYSGRYLGDAQFRLSASTGTELTFGGVVGVRPPALRNRLGGPYHEADAGISQITPVGVFGFDGRYIDFAPSTDALLFDGTSVTAGSVDLVGHIREGGISWVDALYASYNSRLTVTMRIGRSEETIRAQSLRLLTERYTKGDLSIGHVVRFAIGRLEPFELNSTLALGHGFTSTPFPQGNRSDGLYSLVRPSVQLSFGPAAGWTPSIELSGQYVTAPVPQQEQYVLGGTDLRAYEAGTFAGDNGYSGRLSLTHVPFQWGWLGTRPTLFLEHGAARIRDPGPNQPSGIAGRSDVGLELSFRVGNHLALEGYAAYPFKRSGPSVINDDIQRIGARLTLAF